jgi:SPP1 family predicted phage head-tail adaptor
MRAGKLDRIIVVQQVSLSQDIMNEPIQTWSTYLTCYAEWRPITTNERFRAQGDHSIDAGRFITRFYAINPLMRISFDSKIYKITGISEITRRQGLEIAVESWQ